MKLNSMISKFGPCKFSFVKDDHIKFVFKIKIKTSDHGKHFPEPSDLQLSKLFTQVSCLYL